MKLFSELFADLDSTNKTNAKIKLLEGYFQSESKENLAYALFFLFGEKIPRIANSRELRSWAIKESGLAPWMLEECYAFVGDLAETISLLLASQKGNLIERDLSSLIVDELLPLRGQSEEVRGSKIIQLWKSSSDLDRFLITKMLTGSLRVGVSKKSVIKALSNWKMIPEEVLATRAVGKWTPVPESLDRLFNDALEDNNLLPKPFCLASPLDMPLSDLGEVQDYLVEWKWDGIRAQIIKNEDKVTLWSRGEEVINHSFPEVVDVMKKLPFRAFILDGEILVWDYDSNLPAPFADLQKRLGRKSVTERFIKDLPIKFLAYDLLNLDGEELLKTPLQSRRETLLRHFANLIREYPMFSISERILINSWEDLIKIKETTRDQRAEGVMLKHLAHEYRFGRKKGSWWKWKNQPFTFDLVLLYAQGGHGRRAGLYTDFTLAVRNSNGELAPLTKAYSGLTDKEMKEVNSFIRKNTLNKFGPVVHVKPEYVFEIACEGIQKSSRHKIGYALRFPRINRIRYDKTPAEADTIQTVIDLYESIYG